LRTLATFCVATIAAVGLWLNDSANSVDIADARLADAQQMIISLTDTMHSLRALAKVELARGDSAPIMVFPVRGEITSRFQRSRFHPLLQIFRPHQGVDLSAPSGTPIVATAAATVTYVGWRLGDGLTVELRHSGGVSTLYGHCRTALVHVGDRVSGGQRIATVGTSGIATGPHVHFEIKVRGVRVDPIRYLAAARDSVPSTAERLRGQNQ